MRYGTGGAILGVISLWLTLGCGGDSRSGSIDPSPSSGGSAGSSAAETGGVGGADLDPGELVPFECPGSIPPGPTVYLDDNGYWRVGPNDPAGSYCEGGDLVFYDPTRSGLPVARIWTQADVDRLATALETTGCNTVVGRIEIDPWEPEEVITNLDPLTGLVNIRYGPLVVDTREEIESIVGLANVMLVDDFVNIMGSYSGGSNEWVTEHLSAVSERFSFPEAEITCPIADPDESESVFEPERVYIRGHLGPVDSGMALSPVADPSQLRAGFTDELNDISTCWIRPTDGKLVYWHYEAGIHVWQADPWAIGAVQQYVYPANAMGNDEPLDTECVLPEPEFFVTPLTGEIVYACRDSAGTAFCPSGEERCSYYSEGGNGYAVAADRLLIHVGTDDHALVQGASTAAALMVQDSSGWGTAVTPASGTAIPTQADAVRATADGFLVLDRSRGGDGALGELWQVGNDAVASRVGVYPAAPDDIPLYSARRSCVIDADQVAFCQGEGTDSTEVIPWYITRHELDAEEATVVFDQLEWQLQVPKPPITGP